MKYVFVEKSGINVEYDGSEKSMIFFYDDWNDYNHYVLFSAYIFEGEKKIDLGRINIASLNDHISSYLFRGEKIEVKRTFKFLKKIGSLNKLMKNFDDGFISLGSEEFYEKLKKALPKNEMLQILNEINDLAVDKDNKRLDSLSKERVVIDAFFRDKDLQYINKLRSIIYKNDADDAIEPFNWSIKVIDQNEEKELFKINNDPDSPLPTNLFAVIGNNGVGKTRLLKDIARASIHLDKAIKSDFYDGKKMLIRNEIDEYQKDYAIGAVTKILYVSFSSFDLYNLDFLKSLKINKISFLGNRDYSNNYPQGLSDDELNLENSGLNNIIEPGKLNEEIKKQFKIILISDYKRKIIIDVLDEFIWDYQFKTLGLKMGEFNIEIVNIYGKLDKFINDFFAKFEMYSSGQKIILSVLIQTIANSYENSLVLIDEPELYLHPPYILALILSIQKILKMTNSAGIVSTHSAITLQEIPSKNVNIIDHNEYDRILYKPKTETFGADTSKIESEIFGVDIRNTGYYKIIDDFINKSNTDEIDRAIEANLFGSEATRLLIILRVARHV